MTPPSPVLEERLARLESPYRSRGEAQVAGLFRRYGIPFLYESPLLVYDRGSYRIWHPDFRLPTYGGLIVEYAGMPDVPDYMDGIRHKTRVFRQHELPAVFIYPSELLGSRWQERLVARIEDTYHTHKWRECWAHVLKCPPTSARAGGHRYPGVRSREIQPGEELYRG